MFRTLVLFALLACAQVAHAQVLWQGLSAGMTEDQVRRATPTAQPVHNPTTKMTTGAQGKLRVPGVDFLGKPFDATLYFIGDRLSDVQLVHQAQQAASQGRATYNDFLTALRSKYGQEVRASQARSAPEAAWSADGMAITLLGSFEGNSTWITVNYSAGMAR